MGTDEIKLDHGVSNVHYSGVKIHEDLVNCMETFQRAFSVFNEEFFKGQLSTPVISFEEKMKSEYNVSKSDIWTKQKKVKRSSDVTVEEDVLCMYISNKVFGYQSLKDIYVTLVKAMILQYDIEQYDMYVQSGKKEGKGYKRIINNNNNYFSNGYEKYCHDCGLKAKMIMKEEDGKEVPTHRFEVEPGDKFNQVYENYNFDENFTLVLHRPVVEYKEGNDRKKVAKKYICPVCKVEIKVLSDKPGVVNLMHGGECGNIAFVPSKEYRKANRGKIDGE